MNRDRGTIGKVIQNITYKRKTHGNKGNLIVSKREIQKIRDVLRRHPLLSSKAIFVKAGVPNVSKTTCCKVLRQIANVRKAKKKAANKCPK